jgi:hypothetical protein
MKYPFIENPPPTLLKTPFKISPNYFEDQGLSLPTPNNSQLNRILADQFPLLCYKTDFPLYDFETLMKPKGEERGPLATSL